MWRLWNKLFGWDYISWTDCYGAGIDRIYVNPEGIPYFVRYKATNIIRELSYPEQQIFWLTCPASKYFPEFRQTENKNAVKDQCL